MPPRQRQQTEQTPDEKPAPHSARPASSSPGRTTAERLRAPFPANTIGKLPRLTCKECIEGRGTCSRHQRTQCNVCHQWISTAHLHLDYVGHAAVTDRLLEVDPAWSWEPAYRDVDPQVLAAACASGNPDVVRQVIENSPPLIERRDRFSGMWIRLTVDGTTRLGYATDDHGGVDANKILISDGIRNAAMRFGVGLDLWSKEDLQSGGEDDAPQDSEPVAPPASGRDWVAEGLLIDDVQTLLALGKEANEAGEFVGRVRGALLARRAELEKPAA